ncbi:MAG: peptide ABC transporter substrate-binding protein, partial [Anaerolineae bacterium]|nr:peptide ABC transporter substrate-binding protein [Anaerolineae bacterium]
PKPAATSAPAAPAPAATTAPAAPAATTAPAAPAAPADGMNSIGKKLPADAAPSDHQVMVIPAQGASRDSKFADITASVYNRGGLSDLYAISLTRLNKDFETIPGAAKSWKVSADGKTWTFSLREDLNWSDNTPVTAADFIATLQHTANPKTAWDFVWYLEEGNIKGYSEAAAGKGKLEEIGIRQGANPKELIIETTKPTPYLPSLLLYFMPMQKAALERHGPTYNSDPKTAVSSGPFIVTEWSPTRYVATANKNLPDDLKPYLNKIIALPFESQIQAYQAGRVDYAVPANVADLKLALDDAKLNKDVSTDVGDFRTNYFFFDMSKKPFNNVKFRQALARLLDRDSLAKAIVKEPSNKPAYSFLAPGFPGSNVEELKPLQKYDPDMAKKLYAESGEKVDKLTLQVRNEGNQSYNEVRKAVAQVYADEIKKVLGIPVEIKIVEQKVFMDALNAKPTQVDFGMISYGMDYLDQSNMLSVFRSNGRHNWNNANYQKLLDEAGPLTDTAKRNEMYRQAEKLLVEEAPAVWSHVQTDVALWRQYLTGDEFKGGKVNKSRGMSFPVNSSMGSTIQSVYVTKDALTMRPTPPK